MSNEPQGKSIPERLSEFFRRLREAPAVGSAEEAFQQLCETLESVEDELSGIQRKTPPPPPNMPDGRMYPPLADFVEHRSDGTIVAKTRGHVIEFASNGGILVRNKRTSEVEFEKDGIKQ